MHNAPPVVYPVGRFVYGPFLLGTVCVLSAVGLINWQLQSLATGPKLWAAWFCWSVCAVTAAILAPQQVLNGGQLGWSGESWFWQAVEHPDAHVQWVALAVNLDTDRGMLLWVQALNEHGKAQGRLQCAWLEARAMPSKWHGFRCAVYSRPKTAVVLDKVSQERV